ncbi:MAG: hypothetical protein WBL20_12305 [Sphingobium sp.]
MRDTFAGNQMARSAKRQAFGAPSMHSRVSNFVANLPQLAANVRANPVPKWGGKWGGREFS